MNNVSTWEQEVWTPDGRPTPDEEETPSDPPGLELEGYDLLPIDVRGGAAHDDS